MQLDSAFSRTDGGLATLFPIKKESTRLSTSSAFPSMSAGNFTLYDEPFPATHPSLGFDVV